MMSGQACNKDTGTSETIETFVFSSSFEYKELSFGCNCAEDIRLRLGTLTLMSKTIFFTSMLQ
jgi:hypothetical protein